MDVAQLVRLPNGHHVIMGSTPTFHSASSEIRDMYRVIEVRKLGFEPKMSLSLSLSLSPPFINYGKVEVIGSQHQEFKRICMGSCTPTRPFGEVCDILFAHVVENTHIYASPYMRTTPKFSDRKCIKPSYGFI